MNQIDIFILFCIVIPALIGLRSGFLKNLFAFAGIVTGLFFASKYYTQLSKLFESFNWFDVLTNVISFVSIVMIFYFLAVYVASKISNIHTITSFVDKLLGVLFGVIQGMIFASVILIMLNKVDFIPEAVILKSNLYSTVINFAPEMFNFISEKLPFTKQFIDGLTFIKSN
ncbi:MAG TPA: CvpA family protein [Ignavibacteria bacterium]|nr:CvpA family protein [Ignavibacteria bacterium]